MSSRKRVLEFFQEAAPSFDFLLLQDFFSATYLSNREPNLFFALLTDYPDASAPTLPGDAALLETPRAYA